MTAFYLEVCAPITNSKAKEEILFNTLFMSEITDSISKNIDNYHESVKEEA